MNFALLGNIAFDLLNAPTAFDERRSASYAEHAVLSGKPRLQAMGLDLTEIKLQLRLHHLLAPVDERYQALITAKEKQEALALVLGWSQFKGNFVITDINSQTLFSDEQGNTLAREVSLTLREFVGNPQQGVLGAALSLGGNSPLASLLPKGLTNFVSQTAAMVQKGVKVYRQARQAISAVRETVATMKAIANNPLDAIVLLPAVLNQLGGTIDGLSEMVGLGNSFATLTQGLKGAEPFLTHLVDLSEHLNSLQREFKLGLNEHQLGNWFDLGVKALDAADEVAQSMSTPAAQLTAWIAIRGDEPEIQGANNG